MVSKALAALMIQTNWPGAALGGDNLAGDPLWTISPTDTGKIRVRLINMSAFSSFIVFPSSGDIKFEAIEVDGVSLDKDASQGDRKYTSIEIHAGQ